MYQYLKGYNGYTLTELLADSHSLSIDIVQLKIRALFLLCHLTLKPSSVSAKATIKLSQAECSHTARLASFPASALAFVACGEKAVEWSLGTR